MHLAQNIFTDCEIIINDVIPHELNFNVMKRGEIIWFAPVLLLWSFNLVVNRHKRQKFLLYETYVPVDVRRWQMFRWKAFLGDSPFSGPTAIGRKVTTPSRLENLIPLHYSQVIIFERVCWSEDELF